MVTAVNDWLVSGATRLIESGWAPDWATRAGIRTLCRRREDSLVIGEDVDPTTRFLQAIQAEPIAVATEEANEQHYELPPEFFSAFLGPRRKYSCCYWPEGAANLEQAEEASLRQVCQRAELRDGMDVLELGCGWGSLSLWILEHYPNCRVTAVSNSRPQREYIEGQAASRGWSDRLQVITCDMNEFQGATQGYDRVLSLEMFEHMRNHRQLLGRIRQWLREDGKLFVHIFCHKDTPYLFETQGASNWMGRYFFTGGMMPSYDLLTRFPDEMKLQQRWVVNGEEYSRTLEAWLTQFDRNRETIDPILEDVYGADDLIRWRARWRVFLMACSELFAYDNGEKWFVGHYLMTR